MSMYSKETYTLILDQMLERELLYVSSGASEANIKNAMKRVLGEMIKKGILKTYSGLVLDENLNVHFCILDSDNSAFDIVLIYGI
jgi:hypothetical protein